MNQNEQMRDTLDRLKGELVCLNLANTDPQTKDRVQIMMHLVQQTLAAEPAPLVRLTDEDIEVLRHKTFSTNNPFCPCDAKTMRKAANAIMDAMIAKNGGN